MTLKMPALLAVIAFAAMPLQGAKAQNMSEADQQKLIENFVEADANADKVLTQAEFEMLIQLNAADNLGSADRIVRSGRYGMAFGRLDANGDGFVVMQELQSIAEQAGN